MMRWNRSAAAMPFGVALCLALALSCACGGSTSAPVAAGQGAAPGPPIVILPHPEDRPSPPDAANTPAEADEESGPAKERGVLASDTTRCEQVAALPGGENGTVRVFVWADGLRCVGKAPGRDDEAFARQARSHAAAGVTRAVLYVDEKVIYAAVVQVLDLLRSAGISELTFAVQNR